MVKLTPVVDSLDDIDEIYRGLYEEVADGDGFRLTIEVDGGDGADRAATAAKKARAERDTAKKDLRETAAKLALFDGIELDADGIKDLIAAADTKKGDDDDKGKQWAEERRTIREQVQRDADAKLAEKDTDNARLRGAIEHMTRENAISEALAKFPVKPTQVAMARLRLGSELRLDWDEPTAVKMNGLEIEIPRAVVDHDEIAIPMAEWVSEVWRLTDEAKEIMLERPDAGGGARGSNGAGRKVDNPWRKDGLNLFRQGQLLKSNPTMAERLRREAGV